MNLSFELSHIETELESLRAENKVLRETKLVQDFELDQLRRRIAIVEEQRDGHLAGKVRLKTLLDQTGQALVNGVNRFNEEMREGVTAVEQPLLMNEAAE